MKMDERPSDEEIIRAVRELTAPVTHRALLQHLLQNAEYTERQVQLAIVRAKQRGRVRSTSDWHVCVGEMVEAA